MKFQENFENFSAGETPGIGKAAVIYPFPFHQLTPHQHPVPHKPQHGTNQAAGEEMGAKGKGKGDWRGTAQAREHWIHRREHIPWLWCPEKG